MQWLLLLMAAAIAALTLILAGIPRFPTLPMLVHNTSWLAALLLAGSGVIQYDPVTGYAAGLLLAGILAYNLGLLMVRASEHSPDSGVNVSPLIGLRLYLIMLALFTTGALLLGTTIVGLYGFDVLLNDPGVIRADSGRGGYLVTFPLWGKFMFYLGPLLMAITANPRLVRGLAYRHVIWRLSVLVYLAAAQALALQRTNIVVGVMFALALSLLTASHLDARRLRKQFVAISAALVVTVAAFQIIGTALGKTRPTSWSASHVHPTLAASPVATGLVLYASSGVPGFSSLVESSNESWPPNWNQMPLFGDYNPQTWGRATGQAILKVFPVVEPWEEVAPFTQVPMPTNVYTWFEPWYRDFRLVGVAALAFVAGLTVGSVHSRRQRGPGWTLSAALLIALTLWAPFTNRLGSVMTLELLAVIAMLSRWRGTPRTRARRTRTPTPTPADQARGI
jgi:hypothetical protein